MKTELLSFIARQHFQCRTLVALSWVVGQGGRMEIDKQPKLALRQGLTIGKLTAGPYWQGHHPQSSLNMQRSNWCLLESSHLCYSLYGFSRFSPGYRKRNLDQIYLWFFCLLLRFFPSYWVAFSSLKMRALTLPYCILFVVLNCHWEERPAPF